MAEAQAMRGEGVFVLCAGNSAGQAAVHLARYAHNVTVVVRGPSIAATMSDYLVKQIDAARNIDVRVNAEVVDGRGVGRLESITLRDPITRHTQELCAAALFVLMAGSRAPNGWPTRSRETRKDSSSPDPTSSRGRSIALLSSSRRASPESLRWVTCATGR